MPNERISMSKLKQLIELQSSNLSIRGLSRALGLSVGAVSKYLRAVRACGIEAAEVPTLSEWAMIMLAALLALAGFAAMRRRAL